MANSLKTIEYYFAELATVNENTDTNFTQLTIDIPETVAAFRSVSLEVIVQDAETTSQNVNSRQISLRLNAVAYSDVTNDTDVVAAAQTDQKWISMVGDYTAYFTTNWTGTSMTCDAKCLFVHLGTPLVGWRCATAHLVITYEYDATSATQVKTVRIPLITPIKSMASSKPSSLDTIPNLSTFLPEKTVTIKQYVIVVQGNEENSGTTDFTFTWQIDTATAYTTNTHEQAQNTGCWFRHCEIQSFATNATHDWYIYASLATVGAHVQAFLVVTYTFVIDGTSTVLNSLLLPMAFDSPAGNTDCNYYQRAYLDLWIEEPTTITIQNSAILFFYVATASIQEMNYRVNGGAWSGPLGSNRASSSGCLSALFRCDSSIGSLSRGKNTLYADVFRKATTYTVSGLCAVWMINYTSGVASSGIPSHNHSVFYAFTTHGTAVNAITAVSGLTSLAIPETSIFYNCFGVEITSMTNGAAGQFALSFQVQRLTGAEGGYKWDDLYRDGTYTPAKTGHYIYYGYNKNIFIRWTGDVGDTTDGLMRIDPEVAHRYRFNNMVGCATFNYISFLFTYHAITFTVSGTVSGSAGGTVTINMCNATTGEIVQTTSRAGNGAYSFTWYDNTANVFCEAREDTTHVGRSDNGTGA
jgi:hypothetical protein